MRTIRAPDSKQATTLVVAVKCRPLTAAERSRSKSILRVDKKMVLVVPPEMPREYVERVHHRSKERIYAFDHAFGPASTNRDVYETTIASMIPGVIQGLNATIFAYGATGSGKTYTMAGTQHDPGLMVHSLQTVFDLIAKQQNVRDFEVTCSYLEVYNEVIYDLLEKSSDHLELREDPDQGIMVAGLKRIKVNSAEKIFELLNVGNSRRKTESTEANATSSRSHGVLEIIVKHQQKNHYRSQVLRGKLALVDLAGSERASETNNAGQKLRDGANINRSLLALANCINALGKQQKKGLAYVPYRNSKLTRILKDGLSGNSRTVMIATVSPADDQYHYTINTLKYADRAKEIKTHIQKNIGTIDNHVADYQRMIDNLQGEVCQLKKELADKECQLSVKPTEKAADDELAWLDILSRDTNENVEERINLQKALSELEDINLRNRMELQKLDDLIAKQQTAEKDEMIIQALRSRRQVILDNIRDNDEAGANYRKEIEINEQHRHKLQKMIDKAMHKDGNKTYLRILSQYRLLGMTNIELQFQIAVRDQIIHNLREAQSNLWSLLASSGLNDQQILEIATKQGITIEDWIMPPESPVFKKQAIPVSGQCSQGFTLAQSPCYHTLEKSYRTYPRFSTSEHTPETSSNQGTMDDKTSEFKRLDTESLNVSGDAFSQNIHFMQEHHNTFALASHLHSPSALWEMRRGNVMKKKTHHQSAENKIQNYCSNDNVYVDSGESRTLGCWDDSYCQQKYSIYLTPQPLLDFEQPQKESWHVNNDALNCLSGMEIRKSFQNHSSVEVDNVQNLQKSKFGRVLLSMPPGGRETYFIHNKNTVIVLAHSNSRHLVYRGHCSRCKNYPVFSEWRSPLNDQTQRHIATEDSVCQGSKFYSDFEFRYFANPHGQSWPG